MSMSMVEFKGIPIETKDPRRYLQVLLYAMNTVPLYEPALRKALAESLGNASLMEDKIGLDAVMREVGFVGHELVAVTDREWHDYENNEANRFFDYASSHELFSFVNSVFIWGAGPCRLADYLASLSGMDEVTCSDISWAALYFGRAFIEARYSELPELLTRERAFYHVEPRSMQLVRTTKPSRFKPPLTPSDRRHRVRYCVRNAAADSEEPITADLIAVPYLLDVFRGDQCMSILRRIGRRMRVGQKIVVLVTCVPDGRAGAGRDPSLILDVLRGLGFEIQFLDLTMMPYSFSYHSYTRVLTNWNTLVVRAEKRFERDTGP
jgi:hypothetical protein